MPSTRFDFQDLKIALINDEWQYELTEDVRQRPVSPMALKFLDALTNVLASEQATLLLGNRKAAKREHWIAECVYLGVIDPQAKDNVKRAMFYKYRNELIAANRVACLEELTWRL